MSSAYAPGAKKRPLLLREVSPAPRQKLYYFQTDLSDAGISSSGLLELLARYEMADSLLKSASYLMHGGGFSRVGTNISGPANDIHEDGFGWTAGLGYEVRLSRNLFITPMADFYQHSSTTRDVNGSTLPTLYDRLITVGVALTIQSGR